MTDYPEWLLGKVADLVEGFDSDPALPPGVRQMAAFGIAEQILDAVGFERDVSRGILSANGEYLMWVPAGAAKKDYERWRANTKWVERRGD